MQLALDDQRQPGRVDEPQLVVRPHAPRGDQTAGIGESFQITGILHLVEAESFGVERAFGQCPHERMPKRRTPGICGRFQAFRAQTVAR